jgi:hypothetical protein
MRNKKSDHIAASVMIVGLLIVLTGCVPYVGTYWQPHGEWGKLINPSEVNMVSKDTLEVRLDNVRMWFSMWFNETGTFLTIQVRVPEGSLVAVVSNEVELFEGKSTRITKFESIEGSFVTVSQRERLLPNDTMVGKKYYSRIVGEDESKSYYVTIDLGKEEKSQYTIKPPAIKIGNQVFEMPRIEFNKKTGFGIGSING